MEDKIINSLVDYIVKEESKKIVGKVCKRFEIAIENKKSLTEEEMHNLKLQIKELLYEWTRDLRDMLNTGKICINFIEKSKEKER